MSPNPIKFIRFGAMHVTKPYKFIGFGAMDVTIHGCHQTPWMARLRLLFALLLLVSSLVGSNELSLAIISSTCDDATPCIITSRTLASCTPLRSKPGGSLPLASYNLRVVIELEGLVVARATFASAG